MAAGALEHSAERRESAGPLRNAHGARPVHLIITMIKWIRTSRLAIKKYPSQVFGLRFGRDYMRDDLCLAFAMGQKVNP